MAEEYFQIIPPNTCGLLFNGDASVLVYADTPAPTKIWTPLSNFEQFETPEEALVRAYELDPNWDPTPILGSLGLVPVNVSEQNLTVAEGSSVTLNCEYESSEPGATLEYSWYQGDLLLVQGDFPQLTLSDVSSDSAGTYTCSVYGVLPSGKRGSIGNLFTLNVAASPKPSGVINTGRSGASEEDLAPSYFPSLANMPEGVTEFDLELYIPGTNTVISYDKGLPPPYKFDSAGDCFNLGDYRMVIRVASTGQVLSTVYPEAGPNKNIVWYYNPVIPV